MRAASIAFALGAWWLQQQGALWPARATLASGAAAVFVAWMCRRWKKRATAHGRAHARWLATILLAIAAAAGGAAWAAWRADRVLADALPAALEGRDVVVVGLVAALPARDATGTHFPFEVEAVISRDEHGDSWRIPTHLALGWYAPSRGTGGGVPDLQPGQRWRLTVRLKRPHGSANPEGIDYEYWLLEAGLRATGYVRPGVDPADEGDDENEPAATASAVSTRKLDEFAWSPNLVVERVRALLRDRILRLLADGKPLATAAPYAGVIVALVVGDQRAIAQSDWTVFNRTGIGHLVSISGLHVSMLAALGARIAFLTWRRRPRWCVAIAAHRVAALVGVGVAFAYCLLAGFGVPAQRTLYMIGAVALALWTDRLSSPSRALAIALAIVVLLDPWSVTGSGMWLSFTAVAAIFYVSAGRFEPDLRDAPRRTRIRASLAAAGRIQWAVTLALMPLTLVFFDQVSIVSPLANAIAIPLVSFVVTPLALAGAVAPALIAGPLLFAAHGLVAWLAVWLDLLSGTSIAVWSGATPPPWAFVAALIGVAWWLAPRGLTARWAGVLWLVPLFALPPDRPAPGTARLTALDIGQGTAVLVETADANVLFDTGPQYGPPGAGTATAGNDAGNRVILPFLRARGIERLDAMIVSHNDNDHSGGALSILAALPVDVTRSSLVPDAPIVRTSRRHVPCLPGQAWTFDEVSFTLLAPPPDVYRSDAARATGKAAIKPNAKSCVLRVEAAGHVALLTADIERPQERALVERARDAIRADVMLVPHHGSLTSSSDAFLDAVHPSSAIVQAGYLNRFGHPRAEVIARYDVRGITVLRNDRDGAITVTLGPSGVAVDRYRVSHKRYWYGR